MDKTNMVVSKNRPYEKKILRQGVFFGLVVSNTFLCVCLMCYALVCSVDFLTCDQLFYNLVDYTFRVSLSPVFGACSYLRTLNPW